MACGITRGDQETALTGDQTQASTEGHSYPGTAWDPAEGAEGVVGPAGQGGPHCWDSWSTWVDRAPGLLDCGNLLSCNVSQEKGSNGVVA